MKSTYLSLLLITGLTAGLNAEQFRTDINPALLYYQSFLVTPTPLSSADSDYLFSREAWSQPLPERFGKIVAQYDNQFTLVRQAAASAVPCDWGIDFSKGPDTLLPGLARCKAIAQAARLRVMWDLQHDRQTAARDDLLAVFALARNTSRDGSLIAVLVQIASESINCTTIAENFGRFTPEVLKQLADGLDAAPARMTVAGAMPVERASFVDWFIAKVVELQKENPGNDVKVMAVLRKYIEPMESGEGGKAEVWGPVVRAAGGTSDGVLKLLREVGQLYDRVSVILALPTPEFEQHAKEFNDEIRGSSNPLVAAVFPSFEKARSREVKILVRLAMVRAAVEYKLNGEAGMQSVSDPAGQGPFELQPFVFEGVDRGFQLKSAFTGSGFPEVLIFVEKEGPGFRVDGPQAGESFPHTPSQK